jgi:hypothetical protein
LGRKFALLTRKNLFLFGLVVVLLGGTLLSSGCAKLTLGEAQIVVYARGERIVIDAESRYFRQLQLACEEMLISAEFLYLENEQGVLPGPDEIKDEEWAIELFYEESIPQNRLAFTRDLSLFVLISQCLIPLSGELTSFEVDNESYSVLFGGCKIVNSEGGIEVNYGWLFRNCKGVQEIKDILARFDINVP